MRRGIGLVFLATAALMVGGWAGSATAASSGLAVSPAFAELELKTDQATVQYSLLLINRNAVDQSFRLSTVDFGALDDSGGVAFLGKPTSELEHKYGLASWMTLEKDAVFVPAGKTVGVVVTVNNRQSLAPGGHYGAVLATAVTDSGKPAGDSVGVKQVLSSLVLLTKDGGGLRELRLAGQTYSAGFWRLPKSVEQRFQNSGNLHLAPRGTLEVKDSRGVVVSRGAINEASSVILPESFRRYKTDLIKVKPAWLPGRYQLVATYRYDGTDQTQTTVVSWWYAGALVVWIVGLLALAAIGVLAWWLWWRPRRAR